LSEPAITGGIAFVSAVRVPHRSALSVDAAVDCVGGFEVPVGATAPPEVSVGVDDSSEGSVGVDDSVGVSVGAVVVSAVSRGPVDAGLVLEGVVAVGPDGTVGQAAGGFGWALAGPAGTATRVVTIASAHKMAVTPRS
jgi:hypothetical protein